MRGFSPRGFCPRDFCPEGAYVLMKLCMEGVLSEGVLSKGVLSGGGFVLPSTGHSIDNVCYPNHFYAQLSAIWWHVYCHQSRNLTIPVVLIHGLSPC